MLHIGKPLYRQMWKRIGYLCLPRFYITFCHSCMLQTIFIQLWCIFYNCSKYKNSLRDDFDGFGFYDTRLAAWNVYISKVPITRTAAGNRIHNFSWASKQWSMDDVHGWVTFYHLMCLLCTVTLRCHYSVIQYSMVFQTARQNKKQPVAPLSLSWDAFWKD